MFHRFPKRLENFFENHRTLTSNDVSYHSFLISLSFSFLLLRQNHFSLNSSSDQKTLFVKLDMIGQKLLSRLCWPFWATWRAFWIFEVLIVGMIELKTHLVKIDKSNNLGFNLFPSPVGNFG